MIVVDFFVPGPPVGKGRPRFTRAGRVYTPAETRKAEENIRMCAVRAMNGAVPIAQPVELRVITYHLPPKSRTKAQKAVPWRDFRGARPDVDNYVKAAMDALNGVVWTDDALVASVHAAKVYAEKPGMRISVHPLSFVSWPFVMGVLA